MPIVYTTKEKFEETKKEVGNSMGMVIKIVSEEEMLKLCAKNKSRK